MNVPPNFPSLDLIIKEVQELTEEGRDALIKYYSTIGAGKVTLMVNAPSVLAARITGRILTDLVEGKGRFDLSTPARKLQAADKLCKYLEDMKTNGSYSNFDLNTAISLAESYQSIPGEETNGCL